MNALRALLAIAAFLLALVFLLSVLFPRRDELADPELPPEALPYSDQPAEAPAPGGQGGRAEVPPPPRSSDLRITVLDGDASLPLEGAEVALHLTDPTGRSLEMTRATGPGGELLLPGMAAGDYEVVARMPGFFDSETAAITLPDESAVLAFALQPAARVEGRAFLLDGASPTSGTVRFFHPPSGTEHLVRAGSDGRFASPPLPGGVWQVAWLDHPQAQADPRLSVEIPLAPRQVAEVEITLDRPGPGPADGREPGVVVGFR